MACTTILVGKDASYDGSTIIARNEDSANGEFNPKRFIVVKPEEQPREYKSVISHLTITLPDDPLQYTAVPNADLKEGIWGEAGVKRHRDPDHQRARARRRPVRGIHAGQGR